MSRSSPKTARTNLRPPAASFVGRRGELDALATLFDEARLVTLLGPGGMGKTRLALRFAEERLSAYAQRGAGGVWIVELAPARSPSELLATTAAVLGVELAGRSSDVAMADAIGVALARRGRTLLVLDNFEQLASSAWIVDRWLGAAPSARLLVTSRVSLGLGAEQVYVVEPLTPDDATQLFLGRASLVRASTDEAKERALAEEIVEAIDRMPLAIELAASRTRMLSTSELRARLERPLAVLGGGRDRHGSMRGVVLDSVALLPDGLRRLFALASVLRNGFTLEAAEAIFGASALDGLDSLVRTSLLRALVEPCQPTRYAYFETIRDVAEELCEQEPERRAITASHARAFARLAAHLGPHLARELDNLLFAHGSAVRFAHESRDASHALDAAAIAQALEPLLSARGLSRVRDSLFSGVLDALDGTGAEENRVRAEAHLARGLARRELGESAAALADFEAALALAGGDRGLAADAHTRIGNIIDLAGDTPRARERFAQALALLEETDPDETRTRREAEAHLRLGHAHRREGALEPARTAIERAIAGQRALGDQPALAAALYELAVVEMFAGRTKQAFASFDEGLAVARRSDARLMEGAHTTGRGCLLQDQGELGLALTHHAEAARIFHELGSRYREASALYYLATTYLERGEPTEALLVLRQSRSRSAGVGAPRYEALIGGGTAITLAALDRHDEAVTELALAEAALARVPDEPALAATLAAFRFIVDVHAGRCSVPDAVARVEPRVLAASNDDTRFALRALKRIGAIAPEREPLVVWGCGAAFRAPGGKREELPARSPLRRILDRLVESRLDAPGEALSIDDVIRAGWPGEKIGADAALNRAYVALATLRKRGLRELLVSTGGGYALSQAVVVRRVAEPD